MPARIWFVTGIIAALIVYGSLYPFEFSVPADGPGAVATFVASWNKPPGFGDFLANILLYVPLGCCFLLGVRRGLALRLPLTVLAGAGLSLTIELTQYYDAGRDTEATDFYANTFGGLLGALLGLAVGTAPLEERIAVRPAALILAWLGYRLYPYVPTIDLGKYWNALKPVLLHPSLSGYDLFRQTTIWLTLCALIDATVYGRRSIRLVLLFAPGVLLAKVLLIGAELRVAELAGFVVAFAIWLGLWFWIRGARGWITGIVLCVYVMAQRLEPFRFQTEARPFGWIPFHSLMFGSLTVDTLAFLEKFFLYGSLLYLFETASGGHRLAVTAGVGGMLLATSWLQTFLPGRSAELTDTLLVLIIALVFALLPAEGDGTDVEGGA